MLAGVFRVMTSLVAMGMAAPEDEVRVEDILSPELLPENVFLSGAAVNGTANNIGLPTDIIAGNVNEALAIMGFHRRMMNEYLCRSYVAEQILGDIVVAAQVPLPQKRFGDGYGSTREDYGLNSILLEDPGSAGYKKWLSRATTLDDMYNNHADMDDYEGEDADLKLYTSYDEPDYDVATPAPGRRRPYMEVLEDSTFGADSHVGHEVLEASSGSKYGGKVHHASKTGMGLSKEEVFEMIFTAMAVLAFAMFKINVLMSIADALSSMNGGGEGAPAMAPPAPLMIVPLPAPMSTARPPLMFPSSVPAIMSPSRMPGNGGSGGDNGGDGVVPIDEGGDFNISLPEPGGGGGGSGGGGEGGRPNVAAAEELARRALRSLEALLAVDGGACLRRCMCEDNHFSRSLSPQQAAWLPLWSLAMSWVGGTSWHTNSSVLANVHAGCARARRFPLRPCLPGLSH